MDLEDMKNDIASDASQTSPEKSGEVVTTAIMVRDKRRVRVDVDGMWSNVVDTGVDVELDPVELTPAYMNSVCRQLTRKMYGAHMGAIRD